MTIHLSLVDPAPRESGNQFIRNALKKAGFASDSEFEMGRAENGKPWLRLSSAQYIGYSSSYTRVNSRKIAVAALMQDDDIGVDVELWPSRVADQAFLESVAAPEESRTVEQLATTGHDAGIALWVIKEAALKCTGDVMTDPRDLAVTLKRDSLYHVSPSMRAGAPHPDIDVALYLLRAESEADEVLLVGLAAASGYHLINRQRRLVQFAEKGWNIQQL